MSDHDELALYSVRRMNLGPGRYADFRFAERESTLHEAHGAAAEWRAIINDQGQSFYARVEIVIPSRKGLKGFYRIWVGPQERSVALLHLPGENIERRNDVLRAHLRDTKRAKHKIRKSGTKKLARQAS